MDRKRVEDYEDDESSSRDSTPSSSLPSWGFSLPQFPGNPLPQITQNLQGTIRGYFPSNFNLPNFTSAMTSIPVSSMISSFPSMPSIPSMVSSAISGYSFHHQVPPNKSWSQLKESVRRAHRKLFEISGRVPFAFNFAQLKDSSDKTVIGIRIYFLCSLLSGSEITLHYCDVVENDTIKSYTSVKRVTTPPTTSASTTPSCDTNQPAFPAAEVNTDPVDFPSGRGNYGLSEGDNSMSLHDEVGGTTGSTVGETFNNPVFDFKWKPLIDLNIRNTIHEANVDSSSHNSQENLQLERKRMMLSGITSYEYEPRTKRFVFTSGRHLFYFDDDGVPPYMPIRVNSSNRQAKINPVICPSNPDLVAFFSDHDVWVTHLKTGQELRLTNTKYNQMRRALTAGYPCYVIQEEFRRYTGFWWRPGFSKSAHHNGDPIQHVYHILYEEVDETEVELIHLTTPTGGVEEYRFPKAGSQNALSELKLASFKFDESSHQLTDPSSGPVPGLQSLYSIYPNYEYLVRCDWHSRDCIWVQLLNRQQKHLVLGLFSLNKTFPPQILVREDNTPFWVNINDFLHFLPSHNKIEADQEELLKPGSELKFFWISERTGFRHVNLVKVQLVASEEDSKSRVERKEYLRRTSGGPNNMDTDSKNGASSFGDIDLIGSDLQSILLERKQLTSGEWEVSNKDIWIDEKNGLIYFVGLKETPLERHLYCMSYRDDCKEMKRLTESGYSHSLIAFNSNCDIYINLQSNISIPPFGYVHKKVNNPPLKRSSPDESSSDDCDIVYFKKLGLLLNNSAPSCCNINMESSSSSEMPPTAAVDIEIADSVPGMTKPILFNYRLKTSGDLIYGLIFKPEFMEPGMKYPCVLDIYGGPEVQLVTNSFKDTRHVRRHLLAGEGYVVVALDCRGSHNRGIKFEAYIQGRIGQVEIADQVEVLEWLAENSDYIDLSRVAIHGWSYGGYLALVGLAQRPDIFKIAIAGAPVTSWLNYDTGYTERYLDSPYNNQAAYAKGSVLNMVKSFPDEENRLLLVHGLMDENVHFIHTQQLISALIKAGKPYQLQIFPSERHSLRKAPSCEHNETKLLSFLEQHLKPASTKFINV